MLAVVFIPMTKACEKRKMEKKLNWREKYKEQRAKYDELLTVYSRLREEAGGFAQKGHRFRLEDSSEPSRKCRATMVCTTLDRDLIVAKEMPEKMSNECVQVDKSLKEELSNLKSIDLQKKLKETNYHLGQYRYVSTLRKQYIGKLTTLLKICCSNKNCVETLERALKSPDQIKSKNEWPSNIWTAFVAMDATVDETRRLLDKLPSIQYNHRELIEAFRTLTTLLDKQTTMLGPKWTIDNVANQLGSNMFPLPNDVVPVAKKISLLLEKIKLMQVFEFERIEQNVRSQVVTIQDKTRTELDDMIRTSMKTQEEMAKKHAMNASLWKSQLAMQKKLVESEREKVVDESKKNDRLVHENRELAYKVQETDKNRSKAVTQLDTLVAGCLEMQRKVLQDRTVHSTSTSPLQSSLSSSSFLLALDILGKVVDTFEESAFKKPNCPDDSSCSHCAILEDRLKTTHCEEDADKVEAEKLAVIRQLTHELQVKTDRFRAKQVAYCKIVKNICIRVSMTTDLEMHAKQMDNEINLLKTKLNSVENGSNC